MPVVSAGILLFRRRPSGREVFLVHPGGPYWAKKDLAAWSVPKGIVGLGEDELAAARREFHEETGFEATGPFDDLGAFRMPSGKTLRVWAAEGDFASEKLASNSFEMVWPPKSGRMQSFPEIDRGAWLRRSDALNSIVKGQQLIIERFFRRRTAPKSRP